MAAGQRFSLKWFWTLTFYAILLFLIDYTGLFTHLYELDYYTYDAKAERTDAAGSFPMNYSLIHTSDQCTLSTDSNGALLLLVKSALRNVERRNAIRETWCLSRQSVYCIFLVGASLFIEDMQAIAAEAAQHKDIVQSDFIDTYYNNTIKTISGLRWASEFCASKASHFMFVDDDYYVSVTNVLKFVGLEDDPYIHQPGASKELFAGFVIQSAPHRHKFSKWYVPLDEYPFHLWPPYITAGAFILSSATLRTLYNSTMHTRLFRFDDIYLGLAALRADILLTHCRGFHFDRPKYRQPESYRAVIASHGFGDVQDLRRVWTECQLFGIA